MSLDVTAAPSGGSAARLPELLRSGGTARLHLTLAMADYDHVHGLAYGDVEPEGITLTPLLLPVEEIFFRFLKHGEFDVSEVSFAKFLALTAQGDAPMVGIPVFPSRVFRHSALYLRADSTIRTPDDLNGKRIGIPEWAQTAGIYVRGMLQESYGLDLASVEWVQAGVNQAGREEKVRLNLPNGIRYSSRPDTSLNDMLLAGEVDAIATARPPKAFTAGDERVRRLFDDPQAEERRYYAETGIFPIMHTMSVRRTVFERYPWIGTSLIKAFEEAKRIGLERTLDVAVSRIPLPWIASFASDVQKTFGEDFWPYGLEANRTTLEAFCRFGHAQGITERRLDPEDLFPKEVRSSVKV
ncbi:ABC transporter substrate-binding protein [Mangrovibrevibacter kandeliae]|uniref:ABC transporter substrate-binding protein n=1 Tax=Mangrovibrevibacter kandeliae TaxID=2968473 RepID=UPI00211757F8|nr:MULTISPECIES: ABC transporter substrate-binding protein [unclassified Aurantimonas]MCQ8783052.1 ABC transporter substrate-binding protein [Aurantimonas sp. CSK15Z-1]MCW4115758.1 ABC transporter substrate-binding protein [Aurantimonas sp. MSK8Z-1]